MKSDLSATQTLALSNRTFRKGSLLETGSRSPMRLKSFEGGWGFLVVLGSFFVHALVGGFERSSGALYLQIRERFGRSATETAWLFSIFSMLRHFMGPLASALCSRFSFRTVTMIGGVVCSAGFLASAFMPRLSHLYFTYGVLGGVGGSLCYTTSVVVVGHYFNKHRGIAVGLATSGVGLGCTVFSPLIERLVEWVGMTGAFILLAGVISNLLVCGALFRPIELQRRVMRTQRKQKHAITQRVQDDSSEMLLKSNHPQLTSQNFSQHTAACNHNSKSPDFTMETKYEKELFTCKTTGSHLNTCTCINKEHFKENDTEQSDGKCEVSKNGLGEVNGHCKQNNQPKHIEIIKVSDHEKVLLTNDEKHIERSSIVNYHTSQHECDVIEAHEFTENKDKPTKEKPSKTIFTLTCSLMCNFGFVAYCFTAFMYGLGFNLTVVFMPAVAEEAGLSKAASISLVSVFGVSDMIARVTVSCIMDLRMLKPFRLVIFNAFIFGTAVLTSMMTSMHIYWHFALISALFGLFTGAYVSQLSVVLVDMLGVESLASSFGCLLFFIGLSGMIGPTVGGSLRDTYGSYHASFIFATAGTVVSGLTMVCVNVWMYKHNRQTKRLTVTG